MKKTNWTLFLFASFLLVGNFFSNSSLSAARPMNLNSVPPLGPIAQWIQQYQEKALFSAQNANLMTVWSGFKLVQYRGRKAEGFVDYQFTCTNSRIGKCPVSQIFTQTGKEPRPLVIYLSGIFSESGTSTLMRQGQLRLQRMGYHVVTVPNPFSLPYLESRPNYSPGDITEEAKTVMQIIQSAIQQISNSPGAAPIQDIQFLGESYGAFLGGVVAGLFPNFPIRNWIFFHPPLRILDSMQRIDSVLDQNEKLFFEEGCARLIHEKGPWLTEMLFASKETEISERYRWRECQSSILSFGGFQFWLRNFAMEVNSTLSVPVLPSNANQDPLWIRSFRFQYFLNLFSSTVLEKIRKNPEHQELGYWISQGQNQNRRFLVYTSLDDLLNQPEDWSTFPQTENVHLWKVSYGGHFGYSVLKSFEDLLSTSLLF